MTKCLHFPAAAPGSGDGVLAAGAVDGGCSAPAVGVVAVSAGAGRGAEPDPREGRGGLTEPPGARGQRGLRAGAGAGGAARSGGDLRMLSGEGVGDPLSGNC